MFEVKTKFPLNIFLNPRSDSASDPFGSDLRLWLNGHEFGPAHALHPTIRQGGTTAFSHWNGKVLLSLPAGTQNTVATHVRVSYNLRPNGITSIILMIVCDDSRFAIS
jgi:hypothetical protein